MSFCNYCCFCFYNKKEPTEDLLKNEIANISNTINKIEENNIETKLSQVIDTKNNLETTIINVQTDLLLDISEPNLNEVNNDVLPIVNGFIEITLEPNIVEEEQKPIIVVEEEQKPIIVVEEEQKPIVIKEEEKPIVVEEEQIVIKEQEQKQIVIEEEQSLVKEEEIFTEKNKLLNNNQKVKKNKFLNKK
jgi:DNA-directed RNA polymerase beta subunit